MTIGQGLSLDQSFSREAASLLAFICRRDPSYLWAHPEQILTRAQQQLLVRHLKRLRSDYPLAYLLGEKSFYNHTFKVTPSVLIPRPESETIIEIALQELKTNQYTAYADIGTGSGAIIISLATAIKQQAPATYRRSLFIASDVSAAALKIANLNTHRYRLSKKITYHHGDLILPLLKKLLANRSGKIFLAANLPYLTPQERQQEPSIAAEPTLALVGGRDGLSLYRRLCQQLQQKLAQQSFYLMMEINPAQAPALTKIATKYFPQAQIKKISDLSGRTRFLAVDK